MASSSNTMASSSDRPSTNSRIDTELFRIEPELIATFHDMSNEELSSFAELHEDPVNDGQIELHILACFLLYVRTLSTEYYVQAIQRTEGWVAVTDVDNPDRSRRLQILDMMSARMTALAYTSEALPTLMGEGEKTGQASISNQVHTQTMRPNNQTIRPFSDYEHFGIEDLNKAIRIAEKVIETKPLGGIYTVDVLGHLSVLLGRRFEETGSIEDLNRAIEVAHSAVNANPQSHPDQANHLNTLAAWLGKRFKQTGSMDDLDRAIDITDTAVNTTQDHLEAARYLSNLGVWLGERFERAGSPEDLDRAINAADMAVDMLPPDHPARAKNLNNLGNLLHAQFDRTGSVESLNRAENLIEIAIECTAQGDPNRVDYLNNLGTKLGRRFEWTGLMDDLNRAIDFTDKAINATPMEHVSRAGRLNNLGHWLRIRYERTGSMDDLNRAVDVTDMAINATPHEHASRASRLNNLGILLGLRFERTHSMVDISRAIDCITTAVSLTRQDDTYKIHYLNNLATLYSSRFDRGELIEDLNRAIDIADMAVNATPHDHPQRPGYLLNVGNYLHKRFELNTSVDDFYQALSCFKKAWACQNSPPSIRILPAHRAATLFASQQDWKEANIYLQGAVELLPFLSPRMLANDDKQHMLGQFSGLASKAAAISLQAGKDEHQALKLLELGRCVIAGLLLDMRTDISDLKQQYPQLAEEFEALRDKLDSPHNETTLLSDTGPSWKSQANQRFQADERLKELIAEIRSQSGFQNFLFPPTHEELMAAANQGPIVIINVSSYRCDAFLIEQHQMRLLALPLLEEAELTKRIQRHAAGSTSTLEWLWTTVTGPILDALGYKHLPLDGDWPHIWWIPTGALSHFPIHAAGFHNKRSTETVLDRAMSSYASSVKGLLHGRRQSCKINVGPALDSALLVAMQKTPGLPRGSTLPYAAREVEMLAKLCPKLDLKAVMPSRHRKEVLAHLRKCKIFHFAGHGRSDPLDPSRSCLLLDDWQGSPLTVGDLRDYNIQDGSPFLGYLSACSTGANKVDRLVDEGIHLASAFQLAGFRHVIGTLWEVSDSHCVDAAEVVYETIRAEGMTDTAVCRGLHHAVRTLREGRVKKRRSVEEGCGAGVEGNTLEFPKVESVNTDGAKVVQEVVDDNVQHEVHACPPTVAQDGRQSCIKTEDVRNGSIAHRDERAMLQQVRDAKLYQASNDSLRQSPQYWAPYIHFGV